DFSPETPEIGPGPEADVDTPMFDSAFGGGGFDAAVQTPAPTQAMETPLFGGALAGAPGAGPTFDQDAFGGGPFGAAGGTPMPDFSPDTGMLGGAAMAGAAASTVPPPEPRGRGGILTGFLIGAVLALIVGIIAGPYVLPSVPVLPDMLPETAKDQQIAKLQRDISGLNQELEVYRRQPPPEEIRTLTPQELDNLRQEIARRSEELNGVKAQLDQVTAAYNQKAADLRAVEDDIARLNTQFIETQERYDDLRSETSIIQARQKGLIAEVDRLTNLVGGLEEAQARSDATKEALAFAVDRLLIQVKEGIPLTPQKYSRDDRLAKVERLREEVQRAKFVTPEMQNTYTDLYLQELQIAATQEYFFARIIVTDRFGAKYAKWAECLSKGNWAVHYRTLDGKNIGSFENIGTPEAPHWGCREDLPAAAQQQIEEQIFAARVPGFEEKIQVLAEKQVAMEDGTPLQRAFDSL
ncbi:MAG TPA: hypothetical protein PKL84_04845, partial [Candidatus Hydrogenedentes bacterium]|nr:hypothetical protein [Candidatus Hydrogenedentota bacterium]